MTPKGTQSSLQEHEVLFIDFLGFAAAVKEWDDERMEKLIAILSAISDGRMDAQLEYLAKQISDPLIRVLQFVERMGLYLDDHYQVARMLAERYLKEA
jgi:hypothetical protein